MLSKVQRKTDIENESEKESLGYNPYLLSEVQPQGGIRFDEAYTRKGDGYETCIHVYDYQTIVNEFWLEQIMNMPNVVATLDVSTPNRKEIADKLNKSMAEQKNRGETAKDTSDLIEASESYEELQEVYNSIRQGEVMKRIIIRLFVSAKTIDELELSVKEVIDNLESLNFRGSVFLNEQEYEWQSMFTNYNVQQKYANKRKGIEIPSLSLAAGFPFHFTSLNDPYGTHLGTTETNGNVIFDLFHQDRIRKFYNALMIGKMRSGKSTTLKKIALDSAVKGHKVRVLDITGEFEDLTLANDGKVIALDGSNGLINPLQVYKTVTLDDGSTDEKGSFTQHLSKMSVFYRFLRPDVGNQEILLFENILRDLYVKKGLWNDDYVQNITEQPNENYPTMSELLNLVRVELYEDFEIKKIHENLTENRSKLLENIELILENLVKNYGHLFDGQSSLEHFDEIDFVSFPLRNLAELKPEVFQAQLFNVMNMLWQGMLVNGQPQYKAFNKHLLDFEDAVRYLIIIDEAHHIINTEKGAESRLKYIKNFMREARKYFGAIFFASHLITDFVPENADQASAEEIKKIFNLTQYKFISQQDSESLKKLKEVFAGQLNESELAQIPFLQTGEAILSISGLKNLKMTVDVSQAELDLFGGGA
ncbi:type IV secretion system protein VirB4 [Oceanobacillus timonensis]|uniref:VirB4 family type IV secretion system protein n=1 Tax=Oceanobacillus TaxID=182709 RepID=UPI0009BC1861